MLGALAPVELTPEARRLNRIDPKALPSALAAPGGGLFTAYEEGERTTYLDDIRNAVGKVGTAVGSTLAGITGGGGGGGDGKENSKNKGTPAFSWGKKKRTHSSSAGDMDFKTTEFKNYNINLHAVENDEDLFGSGSENTGGRSGFPGQVMLGTAASAISSSCDSPAKRKRLLIVLAAAAIVTGIAVGAGNREVLANSIPSLTSSHYNQDLERLQNNPRFESIRSRILKSGVTEEEDLLPVYPPSAQFQAVEWLTDGDERQLRVDDEYLLQRYALATFWISTYGKVIEQSEQHRGDGDADGAMWTKRENWMSRRGICSWEGVECHHRPGGHYSETHYDEDNYVTIIDLADNAIKGTLPQELFAALEDIKMIGLSSNELSGSLPDAVGKAEKLMNLDLNSNSIEGTLPTSIGNLRALKKLELGDNAITGQIPRELGELTELEEFALYQNNFVSTIPVNLAKLTQLRSLYLDGNALTGSIPPSLGEISSLLDLRLRDNELTSTIPPGLSNLENLEVLYLDTNLLTGSIPFQLSKLHKLEELHVQRNELDGTLSPSLFTLDSLVQFYADHNFIGGTLPQEMSGLKSIQQIYLFENALSGELPSTVGELSGLERFRVDSNMLTGAIPYEMGNCLRLRHLSLEKNNFHGTGLPESFDKLINLEKFYFHSNNIRGEVSEDICKLLTEDLGSLSELTADCDGGEEAKMQCLCCTECH
mmetsp:Transcript_31576/g.68304  ORF Transcript_31576/g.68304 Transcript_31576/m.68304 type:complete len:710 (+) Transcript_31576:917-3046(+)